MGQNFKLRDYQERNGKICAKKLKEIGIFGFLGEVRTGKTLTALYAADLLDCKKVLFITKKKAIKSIEDDFKMLNPNYELIVINYESMNKVDSSNIDMLIIDESHSISSFPKPSKWAKDIKNILSCNTEAYLILLSGTFSPESYSQVYHQFWVSPRSPFSKWKSFYKWAHDFVNIKKKKIGSFYVNDYSCAYEEKIDEYLKDYLMSFTQKEAGFKSSVRETIHYVPQDETTMRVINILKRDKIVEGKEDVIIADTGAKMKQKLHQLFSGTIKLDSGKRKILNTDKAKYIADAFKGQRIAIIYKFVGEYEAIKAIFGDTITNDLVKFQEDNTIHFCGQVQSTKEGTNLSAADILVMYNIDFSATSYFQARARLSTKDRPETDIHWIFTAKGIEDDIYNVVSKKKDYTLSYFRKYLKK